MNKNNIKILLGFFSLLLVFNGCDKYEDFVDNEYDYTSVYFANQKMDRTVVTGEWMKIGVGAMLGGKLENKSVEQLTVALDDAIIDETVNTRLLDSYFKLVDEKGNETDQITIPTGSLQGFIYVLLNDDFVNDKMALSNTYALGFRITSTSTDSILEMKDSTLVTFKYVNTYYGKYDREGLTNKYAADGVTVEETINYDSFTDGNSAWELMTISKDSVRTQWTNQSGIVPEMYFKINADNSVNIKGINDNPAAIAAGSITSIVDDGDSSYNPETRTFTLNYTYTFIDNQGVLQKYEVRDKLTFRNRVIDGVNQWFE